MSFPVSMNNSLFTLPRCQQGHYWKCCFESKHPSPTSTWSDHYWSNPLFFLPLALVCSAHGEDGHISLVPGGAVRGQSVCPHSLGMINIFSAWLQKPWETCICSWKTGCMEMLVAQIKTSLLSMGKTWFYFTSFWLGLNKTVFYKKTRGISQLKTSLCLCSSILSHWYKTPGN